ncbi:DNA-binding transcriptional regulator, LysR family [Nakamurella panacisegetis]|uniref:DNA-binding transcriptional regulator, LysR family n=1 Tax=Nakamurella panacisegetis TaxID=1090615 RepID=A0A1H0IVZ3_9ACTN|nr:LysR substrate-binding domain-containing protein [Nakamurella panacisegetis]SDO35694.1 DNA-binding transcriptional regulator, LysR family [Nakamurella panacisegetis]
MRPDLDLRKLRYFVAVADELNFRRAAEVLMIAQPVLSRQIRAFEDEIGLQLFVRDTRGTELTEQGQLLHREAEGLLASAAAVRRRVAVAARGESVFTVGFMPGLVVTEAVRAFRRTNPEVEMQVMRTGWDDQVRVLHDGRADVSYLRRPFDAAGLSTESLFSEPRVVMLPSDHELATAEGVLLSDLTAEQLLQDPAAVPEWAAAAAEMRRRRGSARAAHRTVEEKLELVAVGQGIAIFPLSTARFYRRADVRFVPVTDLPPTEVHLGWERGRTSRLIHEFVATVRDVNRPPT